MSSNNFSELQSKISDAKSSRSVRYIKDHPDSFDMNAPYQRADVWPIDYKKDLITSILSGLLLPPIHLVKKYNDEDLLEDDGSCWVLDGKQRISAILSFINNELKY